MSPLILAGDKLLNVADLEKDIGHSFVNSAIPYGRSQPFSRISASRVHQMRSQLRIT
jgi:hypothetical protein